MANITVGQIYTASWGWDQSNVDFYEVTRVSEKSVWLRPIASNGFGLGVTMSESVTPRAGEFTGPEFRRKRGEFEGIKIDDIRYAQPWKGQPVLATYYA